MTGTAGYYSPAGGGRTYQPQAPDDREKTICPRRDTHGCQGWAQTTRLRTQRVNWTCSKCGCLFPGAPDVYIVAHWMGIDPRALPN